MRAKKKPIVFDEDRLKSFSREVIAFSQEERYMEKRLRKYFPELESLALFKNKDGSWLLFKPAEGNTKWRNVQQMYSLYLPEINRIAEQSAYDEDLNIFIDGH